MSEEGCGIIVNEIIIRCGDTFNRELYLCSECKLNTTMEVNTMAKLSEAAKAYEPSSKTGNIADLGKVSTDLELIDDSFEFEKNGEVKTVEQKVIEVEGERYRVPITVIQQLKVLLEDNPNLKFFKVKKSGTTRDDTRYQVIPLME